jgi:hypothetical protein
MPVAMRKLKKPPPPLDFVLVRDVLPEFGKWLRDSLNKIGQRKLADQVPKR